MSIRTPKGQLIIFYGIIVLMIIIDACRKIDFRRDEAIPPIEDRTAAFFTVPANTNPIVNAIATRIKRQNDTAHFVNEIAKKIGIPIWNKAIIVSPVNTIEKSSADSIMNYIYIPFGLDSLIRATLIVRTSPEDTLMRLVNDWEYHLAGFDSANGENWNANDLFHIFTKFEKNVYGHKSFILLDHRFAPSLDSTNFIIATLKDTSPAKNYGPDVLTSVTLCDYIDYCYAPPGQEPCNGGICTEDCPQYQYTGTDCSIFWMEEEWGGGSPPYIPWSGGAGGSGGPWWNNTCTQQGAYCGTLGWAPIVVDSFLVNYAIQGYHHFENWTVVNGDNNKINTWKANNIDTIGLDPCVRSILNKLLDTSNLMGKILVKMDQASFRTTNIHNFKIRLEVAPIPQDSNALGWTYPGHYNPVTHIFTDTIRLQPGLVDSASELGVAMVIMHEIIHAYLKCIFTAYFQSSFTASQIANMRVDTMFNVFIDSLIAIHTYQGLKIGH